MIFYLLEKLWCIHLLFCCILLAVEASVDLTTTSAIFLLLYIVPRKKNMASYGNDLERGMPESRRIPQSCPRI